MARALLGRSAVQPGRQRGEQDASVQVRQLRNDGADADAVLRRADGGNEESGAEEGAKAEGEEGREGVASARGPDRLGPPNPSWRIRSHTVSGRRRHGALEGDPHQLPGQRPGDL